MRTGTSTPTNRGYSSFVLCLQEPPVNKGRITGMGGGVNLFYDRSSEGPRAAIMALTDLHMWLDSNHTSGDMVTCLLKTQVSEIYITSVYMDITYSTVWPPLLQKLVKHCCRKRRELIICADTNAHSSLWGSVDTNTRGEAVEDAIFMNNLTVLNNGSHHTFYRRNCQTHIDVTMCSQAIGESIHNWEVCTAVVGSDHLLIQFDLTISSNLRKKSRNYRKGDWNLFQETLEKLAPPSPRFWSREQLEWEATRFSEDITSTLNITHPSW